MKTFNQKSQSEESIWDTIIKDVLVKESFPSATILAFGAKGCGKRSLFNIMRKNISKFVTKPSKKLVESEGTGSKFSYVDYITLPVKDITEKEVEDSKCDMDIWLIENPANT